MTRLGVLVRNLAREKFQCSYLHSTNLSSILTIINATLEQVNWSNCTISNQDLGIKCATRNTFTVSTTYGSEQVCCRLFWSSRLSVAPECHFEELRLVPCKAKQHRFHNQQLAVEALVYEKFKTLLSSDVKNFRLSWIKSRDRHLEVKRWS